MKKIKSLLYYLSVPTLSLILASGCSATNPVLNTKKVVETKKTVGGIQYSIHEGMYSAKVVKAMGSPNIITRDRNGNSTWVYDNITTFESKEYNGLSFVNMNNNDFVIGAGLASLGVGIAKSWSASFLVPVGLITAATLFNSSKGYEVNTSQKTLTLVLDFNKRDQLKSFSYMYSSF